MAHGIVPDQRNAFIERGRFIDKFTFGSKRKQIKMGFSKIDIVEGKNEVILVEVKASSRSLKSGVHQMKYLMYVFYRKTGIVPKGEVRIPSEKKRYKIRFSQELIDEVEVNLEKYFSVAKGDMPAPVHDRYCSVCGYEDLCFP